MNREELKRIPQIVQTYWPNWKPVPTADAIMVFQRQLADLDFKMVVAAIESLAEEDRDFAPGPGVIRRKTVGLLNPELDVDAAWAEVQREIRRVGMTRGMQDATGKREVSFSSEAIRRAVDAIGWQNLCLSEDQMADRAHFIKFYEKARERSEMQKTETPAMRELTGSVVGRMLEP